MNERQFQESELKPQTSPSPTSKQRQGSSEDGLADAVLGAAGLDVLGGRPRGLISSQGTWKGEVEGAGTRGQAHLWERALHHSKWRWEAIRAGESLFIGRLQLTWVLSVKN